MIYINTILKYLKILVIPLITILVLAAFLSIGNLIRIKTSRVTILIVMIICSFVSGLLLGKKTNKKGYLNGFILGLSIVLLLFLLSFLYKGSYNLNTIIYYLVIIFSSMFGAIIGVNKNNARK